MAETRKKKPAAKKPTARPGAKGDLAGGIGGALTGFSAAGPIGGAAMGLMGLLGSHKTEDPQMAAMRKNQLGIQNNLLQYAHSVPGSSQDELANLSEARGQLGAAQRAGNASAMAAWNPNQGTPAGQFVQNQQNAGIAQQMALSSGMLQDAAASRRQALLSAANVGTSAAEMYHAQPSQFAASMGPLMQALAYRQKQQELGQKPGTTEGSAGLNNDAGRLGIHGSGTPASDPYWGLNGASPSTGPNGPAGALTVPGSGGPGPYDPNFGLGRNPALGRSPYSAGDDPGMGPTEGGPTESAGPSDSSSGTPGIAQVLAMLAQAMAAVQGGGTGAMAPSPVAPATPAPAAAPTPTAAPGASGDDPFAGAMQQMLQQQGTPGASQPSAVNAVPNAMPGLQGSMSPGNGPFQQNSTMNQIRQSNGLGRVLVLPGGVRLPY